MLISEKGAILSAHNTMRFLDGMRPSPASIAVEDKKVISDGHSESHA